MKKKKEKNLKCGIVSILGFPNAGKSTFMNNILKKKNFNNILKGSNNQKCNKRYFN